MKWCLREFRLYELPAMAVWFQKMALKGWMIRKINGGNFYGFEKTEPRDLLFSVEVIGNMSLLSAENCEVALDYREYREQAGWEFCCSSRAIQVFCSSAKKEIIPVETDEKLEFEAIWKQTRKQIISQSLLALFWLFFVFFRATAKSLLRGSVFSSRLIILILCIFLLTDNMRGLVWYFKGKKALKEFRKVPYHGRDGKRSFGNLMLAAELLIVIGFFFYIYSLMQSIGFHDGLYHLIYFLVYLGVILALQGLIKKLGFSKSQYAVIAIVTAVVLTFSLMGIRSLIRNSDLPDDFLTKEKQAEWLLTEADFGLTATDETYAYNINDQSLLGRIQEYQFFSDELSFSYSFYETKYDFLGAKLRKELLTPYKTEYADVYRNYITKVYDSIEDVTISEVCEQYTIRDSGELLEENLKGYLLEKGDKLLYLSFYLSSGLSEENIAGILKLAAEKL